jgi:hypothetical protein
MSGARRLASKRVVVPAALGLAIYIGGLVAGSAVVRLWVIAAGAGVIGQAISQAGVLSRCVRQAERDDRLERQAHAARQACLDLLGSAGELRTCVAHATEYRGDQMGSRLAEAREYAAATRRHAVIVASVAQGRLAVPAERLADAAASLAEAAVASTDHLVGSLVRCPDFADLDERFLVFRRIAVAAAAEPSVRVALPRILQVVTRTRDLRQAQRCRFERHVQATRQACLDLLGSAAELRACAANATEYHGPEMEARRANIRECARAIQLCAVSVALLAPRTLAMPAERLAAAAARLAAATAENMILALGVMVRSPDFAEIDEYSLIFRRFAVAEVGGFGERVAFSDGIDAAASIGRAMRVFSRLMPPDAGRRWFAEVQSFLFEADPEQRAKAARSYLRSATRVMATTWAYELSRRGPLAGNRRIARMRRDTEDDAHR